MTEMRREVTGEVEGWWWWTPPSICRLRALGEVHPSVDVRIRYAAGVWFYYVSGPVDLMQFLSDCTGLTLVDEPPAHAAVDPWVATETSKDATRDA